MIFSESQLLERLFQVDHAMANLGRSRSLIGDLIEMQDGSLCRLVPLNGGIHSVIDEADTEIVCHSRWTGRPHRSTYYAGNGVTRLHQVLCPVTTGKTVDHINHIGLDNRRRTLRPATPLEQMANARTRRGSSRYRGVYFSKRSGTWVAQIARSRKLYSLGVYRSETEAAHAYDRAALEHWGDLAPLNFPKTQPPILLISICGWCHPHVKGQIFSHGICARHKAEMLEQAKFFCRAAAESPH